MPHKSTFKTKRYARFLSLVKWNNINGVTRYIILSNEALILKTRETRTISTGFSLKIPEGHYCRLGRQSLEMTSKGLILGGVIVADVGINEVRLVLHNCTDKPLQIGYGDVLTSIKVKPRTYFEIPKRV